MVERRGYDRDEVGAEPGSAELAGRLLRERRLSRGLDPEEVALALKVGAHHVRALEEGRIADLPPQPYARGLVRAYATLLGLVPEELLRICGPALAGGGGGRQTIFRYPDRVRFVWREWAVPFAFAFAVAVIVVARATLTPAPAVIEGPAVYSPPVARPIRQVAAIVDAPERPDEFSPDDGEAPGVRVLLRCEGSSWAEAATDGGEIQRYELGPGQSLEITARESLTLSLGDAGVIRLKFNGRELGFIGFKGETKTGLSFRVPTPSEVVETPVVGD